MVEKVAKGGLAQQLALKLARESGRFFLDLEIHVDGDNAIDMLIPEGRRLKAAAVEPLPHPRHLNDELAVADADLGAVKVQTYTCHDNQTG